MTLKANDKNKYELVPPEGGWGYFIVAALVVCCNVTIIPMTCFGLIFGTFLSSIGDETTGTTLANGFFNTCFNITGLLANNLLQKYSYRIVAFMGAFLFFLGSFATVFATSLAQFVVSFGLIQGLGMGLLFPAAFTALNCYFDQKLDMMNNIAQAFMIGASMVFPFFGKYLMVTFGFRGTVAIISALSLNSILTAAVLQPVKYHLKRKVVLPEKDVFLEEVPLETKIRASVVSLADRAVSVTTLNTGGTFWETLNLGLFKDLYYVNIALGLALGYTADMAFISIIPLVLHNSGFNLDQRSFFLSMFFAADLCARLLLTVLSGFYKLKNRYLFLGGAFFTTIFRVGFVLSDEYFWKLGTVCCLGFLRCFIQTPLPLVIAEQYSSNFATAFSLYMAVCGVVSLVFGPLMSLVKAWTGSDVMVVHLLSLAYMSCVISWSIELLCRRKTVQ